MTEDSAPIVEELFFHATPKQELCKDGQPHDWSGWQDWSTGGTAACSRCGMTAISHSLRYGP